MQRRSVVVVVVVVVIAVGVSADAAAAVEVAALHSFLEQLILRLVVLVLFNEHKHALSFEQTKKQERK